jgi:hypothetical protein
MWLLWCGRSILTLNAFIGEGSGSVHGLLLGIIVHRGPACFSVGVAEAFSSLCFTVEVR